MHTTLALKTAYLQIVFPNFVEDARQQFIFFTLSACTAQVTIGSTIHHSRTSKVRAIWQRPAPALLLQP